MSNPQFAKLRCISCILLPLLLSSCFQEDPRLQEVLIERDLLQSQLEEIRSSNTESVSVVNSKVAEQVKTLEADNLRLKEQLGQARAEAEEARGALPPALSEAELLIGLRVATGDHLEAIRKHFDIADTTVSNLTMPDALQYPYGCGVKFDLVERATGRPYRLAVKVRADTKGGWDIPAPADLLAMIEEEPTSISSGPAVTEPVDDGHITDENWRDQMRVNRVGATPVESLPDRGGVSGGGQVTQRDQRFPETPQPLTPVPQPLPPVPQPVEPAPSPPSGPGLGTVSRDIRVNW